MTRSNPVPVGQVGTLTDPPWDLKVLSATPDAGSIIAAENQFNEPARPGLQFFLVEISFTHRGPAPESPLALKLEAVGDANVVYSTLQDRCGVMPEEYSSQNKVFSGGTVSGNVCWKVRSTDAPGLVMVVGKLFSFTEDEPLFMALH